MNKNSEPKRSRFAEKQIEPDKLSDNELVGQLVAKIADFRSIAEIAWSKRTVTPELRDSPAVGRFRPLGQSAATTRLLTETLHQEYPNLHVQSVVGKIADDTGRPISDHHHWVEIPLQDDTLIIDVTPDQKDGLGVDAPPTIVRTKSTLTSQGFTYEKSHEDINWQSETDQVGTFQRLKKRFERAFQQRDYYKELLGSNIFILAPVAAGKTELAAGLQEILPHSGIDVGKLFRIAAYLVLHDPEMENRIDPDIAKLELQDQQEIQRIVDLTYRKTKMFERGLMERTTTSRNSSGGLKIMFDGSDLSAELESKQVSALTSVIAKSQNVRDVIWRWIDRYATTNHGLILTGHSLKDIDTTKYRLVQLFVDQSTAAQRLSQRNPAEFQSEDIAVDALRIRNSVDKVGEVQALLANAKDSIRIDTSNLSLEQVKFRALAGLIRQSKKAAQRNAFQAEAELKREDFSWEVNPLLSSLRALVIDEVKEIVLQYQTLGVTEFDIAIQTMIHIAGYDPQEIWLGNATVLGDIENLIKMNKPQAAVRRFEEALTNGDLYVNKDAIIIEAQRQAERLAHIYETTSTMYQGKTIYLPAKYMGNPDNSPFANGSDELQQINAKSKEIVVDPITGERQLYVNEQVSGKRVILKRVPSEISSLYGKGFHYLHEGRMDEAVAYGAFVEGEELPFAWVSYSQVDRGYKQEMLTHLGLEHHRILEMTRAWNASWSPKNTMSILFAFCHGEMVRESQEQAAQGDRDKPIYGIITAINSNLGFKANAFNGVGFETVGFKPANFTYYRDDNGVLTYMSRRGLVEKLHLQNTSELEDNPHAQGNLFPLFPTNEMVVLFDKKRAAELHQKPIYAIDPLLYKNS